MDHPIKDWAQRIDVKTPVEILSESMSYDLKIVLLVGISIVNHLMIIFISINSLMKKMLTMTLKKFYDEHSQCFKFKRATTAVRKNTVLIQCIKISFDASV